MVKSFGVTSGDFVCIFGDGFLYNISLGKMSLAMW